MAEKSLHADPNHDACIPCSNNDCPHPICINAKLSKMKKMNAQGRRAGKRKSGGETVVLQNSGMESSANEDERELMWQDLLGVLEIPADDNDSNGAFFSEESSAHATLDGKNDPQDEPIAASQPHRWDHEMQGLGNESETHIPGLHNCMEESTARSRCVQKFHCLVRSSKACSRQIVPVSQPLPTEQARSNCNGTAAFSHDPQLRTMAHLVANIPTIQYGVNRGIESDMARNPSYRVQYMRKLFGILSLIFQAFEGPCTAGLEEHYASVLQRALDEILHAKGLCK